MHDLKIYYLSNSGLMLQWGDTKMIIDGLFSRENFFNPFCGELERQVLDKCGICADADYLLFTHGHADHYDYSTARAYMNINERTVIAAPEYVFFVGGWVLDDLKEHKIKGFCDNEDGVCQLGDVNVYYYRTPHLSYDMTKIGFHYSFVIDCGGDCVFISGDAILNEMVMARLQKHERFIAAFFNPLVLHNQKMKTAFLGLEADQKFIYHLPKEENDRYLYRIAAVQAFEKNKEELGSCRLLLNEMEMLL